MTKQQKKHICLFGNTANVTCGWIYSMKIIQNIFIYNVYVYVFMLFMKFIRVTVSHLLMCYFKGHMDSVFHNMQEIWKLNIVMSQIEPHADTNATIFSTLFSFVLTFMENINTL